MLAPFDGKKSENLMRSNKPKNIGIQQIRKYEESDLKSVTKLYESMMSDYVHISLSENFLEYFMEYHGVYEDGILIVEDSGEVVGFEIISILSQMNIRVGNIITFLARDIHSAELLLESAENYCIAQHVDLMIAAPPPQLATTFDIKRWDRFVPSVLIAKGITLVPLLEAILSRRDDFKRALGSRTILLLLEDETIQISVKQDKLEVKEIDQETRNNSTLVSDKKTLLNIIFGHTNPFVEYFRGKLSIKNRKDVLMILKLLRKMKLKDSIFTSLADRI